MLKKFILTIFLGMYAVLPSWSQTARICSYTPLQSEGQILSLDEISHMALQNNFAIQIAKFDTLISRTGKSRTESIFDTFFSADIQYRNNRLDQVSSFVGNKSVDHDYNLGVSKKFSSGTTVKADWMNNRNWSDSVYATLNPSHDSSLGVTVEQNLGKNLFGWQDRGKIKISQMDIENAQFTSLEQIEMHLAGVQKSYWSLVLQRERMAIEKDMVKHAKELYELNRDKLQHGLVEKPDAIAAEANYKSRLSQLILVENTVKTKENILRLLLDLPDTFNSVVPGDKFCILAQKQDVRNSLKLAFENRYDYQRIRKMVELKDIQVSLEDNNVWPEINLTASFKKNGVDDKFGKANEKIVDEDQSEFFTGLFLSYPLENREAEADKKQVELEKAKILISLKQVERTIAIDINDQVRLCHVLKEVADNYQEVANLNTKKLEEEQKRFNSGRSSTDTIIRFQEDLAQAQWVSAQAKYNYQVAIIDLRLKEGTLLKKYWNGAI